MGFVVKLICSFALVAAKLSAVYSSIHFDEVEFYDPNKTLDESTSNGFVCAHLSEKCQISAQCCGVATCAIPSWSETPVCLVPGYKHDERFRKRFFSVHNLRPADIRYIRDAYNTSQYDFLLTDLTFSAPPLDDVNSTSSSSSETIATNTTLYNDTVHTFGDLFGNDSVDSISSEDIAENSQMANASLEESYAENSSTFIANEKFERDLNDSAGPLPYNSPSNDSALIDENISRVNLPNSSQIENFDLKTHFMFLLMNNTLRQSDSKLGPKEFYDQGINTDRFKNVVERLRERMREINEMEKNKSNNNTENTSHLMYNRNDTDNPTTEKMKTTEKITKWNVVKRFFFHRKNLPNGNYNITSSKMNANHLKDVVDEIRSKEMPKGNSQESTNGTSVQQSEFSKNLNDNVAFQKIIEDVDKIEEIIDRDRTINTLQGSKNVNNAEGLFDFYNINLPLASFDEVTGKPKGLNNSIESVFKDIGDTINSMILDTRDNEVKLENNDLVTNNNTQENNVTSYTNECSILNQSNLTKYVSASNETHFWDKIHFWRIPQNLSAEVEKSVRHLFFPKKKLKTTKKPTNPPLNEYYLLNLNSNSTQERVTSIQAEQTEKTSDYSSLSTSSESDVTNSEELYNNSYVFMVHKEHFSEPAKLGAWKKVMKFFHRDKVVPGSREVNIGDKPASSPGSYSPITESESNSSIVDTPKIIRLPEYLMPQALDKRQENETDWIFDDSEDLEGKIIEEQKSPFLFFFK